MVASRSKLRSATTGPNVILSNLSASAKTEPKILRRDYYPIPAGTDLRCKNTHRIIPVVLSLRRDVPTRYESHRRLRFLEEIIVEGGNYQQSFRWNQGGKGVCEHEDSCDEIQKTRTDRVCAHTELNPRSDRKASVSECVSS